MKETYVTRISTADPKIITVLERAKISRSLSTLLELALRAYIATPDGKKFVERLPDEKGRSNALKIKEKGAASAKIQPVGKAAAKIQLDTFLSPKKQ